MGSTVPTPVPTADILTTMKTDYCGNIIYEDGALSKILTEEGYITLSGTTPVYHYFLKDHQGNNRVVLNQDGTVEQVSHYYPFGGLFGDNAGGSVQPYLYNGKELDRMHGLDLFDYGARHYDAAIGRWFTMDPLAEIDYSVSPYVYCANSPVKNVDLDGREKMIFLQPHVGHNDQLIDAANRSPEDPGAIHVWAHGSSKAITVYIGQMLINITSAKQFEQFLSEYSDTWKDRRNGEKITIVLHCCNTGNEADGRSSIARLISKLKNTEVIAPAAYDLIGSGDDEMGSYNCIVKMVNGNLEVVKVLSKSVWNIFSNGEETDSKRGDWMPSEKESSEERERLWKLTYEGI
jgi:RHS repeat-associated protein